MAPPRVNLTRYLPSSILSKIPCQMLPPSSSFPNRIHVISPFNFQSTIFSAVDPLQMESLPVELCNKVFCFFDHHTLAAAHQVCRKWRDIASDEKLWLNLFKERWGEDQAAFFTPSDSQSWRYVYAVQDRCDRFGLGVKIIREGTDYYIISRGEIQRYLGSKRRQLHSSFKGEREVVGEESVAVEPSCSIFDKILCFIGDLEVASAEAKRRRKM